ncbi:MAG: hypothetical protein NC400_12240 [Clostridium sp.]|nr:hypothetical protein [Clostridium sp.]
MAWLGVITNAGRELLGGWLAGETLRIDGAAGGSGTVREAALLAQTALVEQKQAGSIVAYKTVEGGQKVKIQFPAAEAAYTLNQIGIWGSLAGESVLLALFQNPEGVAISSKAEFPDFAYTFYAVLAIGNEGSLAVTVDTETWVTYKTMQEALSDYVKTNEEGKIPSDFLPDMDYIPTAEKNAAGGVAGLDAQKKIVVAQLPMDTVLSNTSENPVQNKVVYAALADKVPTARKVNGKALSGDISLTAADVGARPSNWIPTAAQVGAVPTTRKVNNKALSADISLSATDVGAAAASHSHTAAQVGAAASNHTHSYLPLSGGTLTGLLALSGNPTANLHAAPKQYVDSQITAVNSKMAAIPWINTTQSVSGRTDKDIHLATLPSGWGVNDNILICAVLGVYAQTGSTYNVKPDNVLMCAGTVTSAEPASVYINTCYVTLSLFVSNRKVYARVYVNNGGSTPYTVPLIGAGIAFNLSKL